MAGANSLYSRLRNAEDKFLTALEGGDSLMVSFYNDWASLQRDIQTAQREGTLTQELAGLAHTVSTRISLLAEAVEELDQAAEQLSEQLHQELDRLVGVPALEDKLELRGSTPDGISRNAPYIRSAYAWLMNNLHNPYPSKKVKESIARESGSPVKLIDGWFVDVRKRIGWSQIKKTHFQNKRKPLIEAAACFVNGGNLPPKLMGDFVAMEDSAEDLYSGKFTESELVTRLSDEYPTRGARKRKSRSCYPSPKRSPSHSCSSHSPEPVASDVSSSLSGQLDQSGVDRPASAPRKRPRSEEDSTDDSPQLQSHKRMRCVGPPTIVAECGIPSPAPSPKEPLARRSLSPATLPKRRQAPGSAVGCRPRGCRATGLQTTSLPILASPANDTSAYRSRNTQSPSSTDSASLSGNATTSKALYPQSISPLSSVLTSPDELPQFSYELPGPVSCEQPGAIQAMDFSLFNSEVVDNYHPVSTSVTDENGLYATSALLGNVPHTAPSTGDAGITSLSSFLNNPLDDDQLLRLLPLPFNQIVLEVPPISPVRTNTLPDLTEDISFNPFLNLDATTHLGFPEPPIDDIFFSNFFNNISATTVPFEVDTELAYLETLRKHHNQVQQCIQSLERHISSRPL